MKEEKEEKIKIKKKRDKIKIATQIIAGIMALLMILGIGASFLYYIF